MTEVEIGSSCLVLGDDWLQRIEHVPAPSPVLVRVQEPGMLVVFELCSRAGRSQDYKRGPVAGFSSSCCVRANFGCPLWMISERSDCLECNDIKVGKIVSEERPTEIDTFWTSQHQATLEYSTKVLLAGVWLMEHGCGRLALLPYVYATGHWRCEFHLLGRPKKVAYRYSIANESAYLASHSGGSIRRNASPQKVAEAIWKSVPMDIQDALSGEASEELLVWIAELRRQLECGFIPIAFGEDFGERSVWALYDVKSGANGPGRMTMPAIPGYVVPGSESSVLETPFWKAAEGRSSYLLRSASAMFPLSALGDDEACFALARQLSEVLPDADPFERSRLLRAAIGELHHRSNVAISNEHLSHASLVSTHASSNPVIRRATRLLSMIHELHKAGYQRLRLCCGWVDDGSVWVARIFPSSHAEQDGWSPARWAVEAAYATNAGSYFGWTDAAQDDARALANKFLNRFPGIAREAAGNDWAYAGWFSRIFGKAEHGDLPAFFGGDQREQIQLPPPSLNAVVP